MGYCNGIPYITGTTESVIYANCFNTIGNCKSFSDIIQRKVGNIVCLIQTLSKNVKRRHVNNVSNPLATIG